MDSVLTKVGWIDVVLIVALILGLIFGLRKKLVGTFPPICSLAFSVFMTMHYYKLLGNLIGENSFLSVLTGEIVSFLLVATAAYFLAELVFLVLSKIMQIQIIEPVDKTGGAILGMVYAVFLFAFVSVFLLNLPIPFFTDSYYYKSVSGPYISGVCRDFHGWLIASMPVSWAASLG